MKRTLRSLLPALTALALTEGASAQLAPVQWRVESGGNGHWYQVSTTTLSWSDAWTAAVAAGGHLVTVTSAAESNFLKQLSLPTGIQHGLWSAGSYLPPDREYECCTAIGCCWGWANGDPFSYTPMEWGSHEPSVDGLGARLAILRPPLQRWAAALDSTPLHWIVEWSRDCNNDGITDYGQILNGQLPDANGNGVPDFCEDLPCPADIDGNGIVNGPDLAFVLSLWGTDGEPYGADINDDGSVDAMDVAYVLSDWGSCGN